MYHTVVVDSVINGEQTPVNEKPKALSETEFVCLIAALTSLTAFSIDALLPALRVIGLALGVNDLRDTQYIVTVFVAGMMIGELLFGPVADAIGRKPVIVIGLFIYLVGTLIAVLAGSLEGVLLGRCIQGLGVSGPKIATRAIVRDLYIGDKMARIMSLMFTLFILVPMIAPAIGTLVVEFVGWRAIFVLYMLFSIIVGGWFVIRQPETLQAKNQVPLSIQLLLRNVALVVLHPRVMSCTFAAGCLFGGQLLFLSVAQSVFLDVYAVSRGFAFYFAVLAAALGMAAYANSRLVVRFGMVSVTTVALCIMAMLSITYVVLAIYFRGAPPLTLFMLNCFFIFACVGGLMGNISAMAMESVGSVAGLGASLMASISSGIAFIFASGLGRLYQSTVTIVGVGFLLSSLGALTLILLARRFSIDPIRVHID